MARGACSPDPTPCSGRWRTRKPASQRTAARQRRREAPRPQRHGLRSLRAVLRAARRWSRSRSAMGRRCQRHGQRRPSAGEGECREATQLLPWPCGIGPGSGGRCCWCDCAARARVRRAWGCRGGAARGGAKKRAWLFGPTQSLKAARLPRRALPGLAVGPERDPLLEGGRPGGIPAAGVRGGGLKARKAARRTPRLSRSRGGSLCHRRAQGASLEDGEQPGGRALVHTGPVVKRPGLARAAALGRDALHAGLVLAPLARAAGVALLLDARLLVHNLGVGLRRCKGGSQGGGTRRAGVAARGRGRAQGAGEDDSASTATPSGRRLISGQARAVRAARGGSARPPHHRSVPGDTGDVCGAAGPPSHCKSGSGLRRAALAVAGQSDALCRPERCLAPASRRSQRVRGPGPGRKATRPRQTLARPGQAARPSSHTPVACRCRLDRRRLRSKPRRRHARTPCACRTGGGRARDDPGARR